MDEDYTVLFRQFGTLYFNRLLLVRTTKTGPGLTAFAQVSTSHHPRPRFTPIPRSTDYIQASLWYLVDQDLPHDFEGVSVEVIDDEGRDFPEHPDPAGLVSTDDLSDT